MASFLLYGVGYPWNCGCKRYAMIFFIGLEYEVGGYDTCQCTMCDGYYIVFYGGILPCIWLGVVSWAYDTSSILYYGTCEN